MTVRAFVFLVGLLVARWASARGPGVVAYVHVEANEGASSGGHVALRLGDDTYHFQHEHGGVLRLHRDDWVHFRTTYGVLQNRTMGASRIALPENAAERLRREFNERYLLERRLFAHRDALRDDHALLEGFLVSRRGEATAALSLRGAGFFFPAAPGDPPSEAVAVLRRRVEDTYGAGALARRMAAIRRDLRALALPAASASEADAADGTPSLGYPFSRHYRDLMTGLAALTALERALPLRSEACWPATSIAPAIDPDERQVLAQVAVRLTDELTRLFASDRPDWGFAFLVGMARLAAVRTSEASGRLVLLDAFPSGAEVVSQAYLRRHPAALASLVAEATDEFARARAQLGAAVGGDERELAGLETAGNRLLALRAAADGHRDLRVAESALVPSRDGPWPELVVPDVPDAGIARSLARARVVERHFSDALAARYGYNLITRNCVSEIFQTVDAAGIDLSPHLGTVGTLEFIPFVSSRAVDEAWPVAERTILPSYRRARVDEMRRAEGAVAVWLREGNVLSSTVYGRNPDDSVFLLFTDDVVAPRPLFGALNLAAGLGAAAAGVALLPFDRGHTLVAGVRGVVFSLPELAFVSLRKGSFDHAPRAGPARSTPVAGTAHGY